MKLIGQQFVHHADPERRAKPTAVEGDRVRFILSAPTFTAYCAMPIEDFALTYRPVGQG